jgi:hypothetical protein
MIVSSFIIQANVITIVNYDRQTFIIQATGEQQRILLAIYLIGSRVIYTTNLIAQFRSVFSPVISLIDLAQNLRQLLLVLRSSKNST